MKEDFLHFIWKNRLFSKSNIKTVSGEKLEIISTGTHNFDSGPDFFNAKIRIGNTIWAGNVEIHTKASDWYLHRHNEDDAYNNVILHVVETADREVLVNGKVLPCLVLNYPAKLKENYLLLLQSEQWIACEDRFRLIDPFEVKFWSGALLSERLLSKTGEIRFILQQNKNDWNETFYQLLARNFGMKTNALPFELLAKATPLNILGKHKNNLFQIEALLFGQSGLLNEELIGDDYFLKLREEYSFLYKKYKLNPIEAHLWKFMRLRPVNFPTIRISQFAQLICKSTALFSKILETESLKTLELFFDVESSEYWANHYRFNKASAKIPKRLGSSAFQNIVINTIAPVLFIYGDINEKHELKDRALRFLDELPAESNSIIDGWEKLEIRAKSAFESQALLQLKNGYCKNKKCLDCRIGAKIIRVAD
ncbi:MAG: hypothetical protein A2W90_20535 [Bacteroidetes bacterium GWF2_42_66]|nr:MAG: hypothetical protein A2W92_06400 [Bacteroidetes bacterium GWA2_42_15]OFX98498.1 MAG: hypothetical protein A2W89_08900 [Bacteroidetes bacterium GWE2_42_39]OFY42883.1 MAG: hypothetical protein A2W90_20535 [Bacteroidetes bacterium GWF2_42_66]HBL75320.1 DUF2851 domain-containing protein [Prolixibacteraceae bacterium]HCR91473.1 DUF2851 domain-containing protein [Prolixibacteraceae bacterium]